MTEAELLAEVTALCGRLGLLWHHCGRPDKGCQGNRGLPDLIIAGPYGVIFAELKSQDAETSADQDLWGWTIMGSWHGLAGCPPRPWHIWRPSDLADGEIRRHLEDLGPAGLPI